MPKRFIVVRQHCDGPALKQTEDPRLHGIALGLSHVYAPTLDDTLPDRLHALMAQLHAQDADERVEEKVG